MRAPCASRFLEQPLSCQACRLSCSCSAMAVGWQCSGEAGWVAETPRKSLWWLSRATCTNLLRQEPPAASLVERTHCWQWWPLPSLTGRSSASNPPHSGPGGTMILQAWCSHCLHSEPPGLTLGMMLGRIDGFVGSPWPSRAWHPQNLHPKHAAFCNACTDIQSGPHRDSSGTANLLCITRDLLWLQNKHLSLILLLIITAIGMAFLSDVCPEHQAI